MRKERRAADLQLLTEVQHLTGQQVFLSSQPLPLAPFSRYLCLSLVLLQVKSSIHRHVSTKKLVVDKTMETQLHK